MSDSPKHEAATSSPMLSNKTYDAVKWATQYFLPALGTLYFALSLLWGLPNAEEVVGTVVAIEIFLGALMGLSAKSYKASDEVFDGALVVERNENGHSISGLDLGEYTLEELENKGSAKLKVVPPAK